MGKIVYSKTTPNYKEIYEHFYRNHFVYTDSGRAEYDLAIINSNRAEWKEGHKFIGDCGVRTMCLALGIDYSDMWYIARKHGFRKYKGWTTDGLTSFIEKVSGLKVKKLSVWGRGKTTTVFEFVKQYPKGEYIILTTRFEPIGDHISYVRDGRVFDNFLRDSYIHKAYKILDKSC